jgi:Na+/melibiose symporter-like transporter
VIGPPIAAPLLITFGVQWALILNAASFAFSFICVHAISAPETAADDAAPRAGFRAEFRTGIRFFAASRVLVTLAVGIVMAMLGLGAVNSLAVFFIPYNLHVTASWIGALAGAVGAGAIAGSLVAGAIARWIKPATLFWLSLIVEGLALVGLSRSTTLPAALAVTVLLGLGAGGLNAAYSPIILSATPAHLLGRVSAVLSPLQQLASIVSLVLAGVLASTVLRGLHAVVAGIAFGPYDTVFAIAGLLFVIAGVASIAPLRGAGRSPGTEEPGTVDGASEVAPP